MMDDYLAMLLRRLKVILIPALLAPLAGFCSPMFFRRNIPRRPRFWWKARKCRIITLPPIITADFAQRVQTLSRNSRRHPYCALIQTLRGQSHSSSGPTTSPS